MIWPGLSVLDGDRDPGQIAGEYSRRGQKGAMTVTTRVDLHCHSIYSDGTLTPRELAESLGAADVAAAALADHDSIDGLAEFSQALAQREIGFIPGVEITVQYQGQEAHLLAYGFNPAHPELRATLLSLRQARAPGVQSVAETLLRRSAAAPSPACPVAPGGRIDLIEAIALVHRAGGKAFLAHPLILQPDFARLELLLVALKAQGLDGIEAIYPAFSDAQRSRLCALAKQLGLLVSAGRDAHDYQTSLGIAIPTLLWKEFRDAVCAGPAFSSRKALRLMAGRSRPSFHWRSFLFRFLFPTLLAIALFVTAIYAVLLPAFERSLLDRKREMIQQLTNSAWSILASYERDERAGRLTREQAQSLAISRIASLRYGPENKDYFWLQDFHPRIIMHPYRPALNGQDVSQFRDPRGVPIFVEFVKTIRQGREGYVRYVWQWKDNPNRLAPKESYIKEFAPWGWIIGTGIYTEDVQQEIKQIERSLARTSLAISVVVAALLLFVLGASLRSEKERAKAETELQASSERYRSLVEATTEGLLLVISGRCRYANPIFLTTLGANQPELELLDLSDLFPEIPDNRQAWEHLRGLLQGEEAPGGFDGVLRRRDGVLVECAINASRINFAGQSGFILLTRQINPLPESAGKRFAQDQNWRLLQAAAEAAPIGLFRARANSRGSLVAHNRAAARLLACSSTAENAPLALADSFPDPQSYEDFLLELQQTGSAERKLPATARDLSSRRLAITAFLTGDEADTRYIDGMVEDITVREKHLGELDSVLARLQTSLLFLHEPVSRIAAPALFCRPETPLPEIAARMSEAGISAALVQGEEGEVAGIITDHDIRQWVATGAGNPREPVSRVMSAPLVTIPEHAEIHEALLLMEQRGIQHLAMTDEVGRVVGVVRNQALLQFRSYGPIVLLNQIEQAATPEAVVEGCRCLPDLTKSLLDCGAHPHLITRMISSVCDAATLRFIALAEAEFGPVATPFVWLALGSQGRQEMTLASDQDNAILYEAPPDPAELPRIEQALQQIGRFVCDWLNQAGFAFCRGEAMASNPRWCQPLTVWQQYFSDWIESAEPKPLLEFSIFFDFRPVYGPAELANQLRRQVSASLQARPAFFPLFAQNSLLFKPPARGLGRLLSGGGGDHPDLLDLKEALMPIVSFARLYALRQGVEPTHTIDRLKALGEADMLPATSCQEIIEAYEFIMRLRLQHQALQSATGQTPDNAINYRKLGQLEQTLLNQSFSLIAAIQKRISYDFLGGTV